MHALLIGAGQLGSRHLQGLAGAESLTSFSVIEPSAASRKVAESRFAEIDAAAAKPLRFIENATLPTETTAPDYAVLATGAKHRLPTLQTALGLGVKRLLCEKVLFPSIAEYRAGMQLVENAGADARVSHIMRYVPLYQNLRAQLAQNPAPLTMEITGGEAGMGCNLIHYLDLFQFITGHAVRTLQCRIAHPVLPSKRGADYIEFTGEAEAETAEGDRFHLNFHAGSSALPTIEIRFGSQHYRISEGKDQWSCVTDDTAGPLEFPFMSGLSGRIFQDILAGHSPLPTLAECFEVNRMMLNAFNAQLHETYDEHTHCPIT